MSTRDYVDGRRDAMRELAQQIADLKTEIASLRMVVDAHGEVLDAVRNRVYSLEHSGYES